MTTLLAIDPGITATSKNGGWLPDLGLIKTWVDTHYGPVTRSLAYVTYQPRTWVGTPQDDQSDNGRDQFCRFLEKVGYTDISQISSTQAEGGTLKCNVDTSLTRDIWSALVHEDKVFSPLTGYYSSPVKGPYDTFVGVIGDWDIVRPLVSKERLVGIQPTLMDLGIKVVIIYKEGCTKREILDLADKGIITFIPLEEYRSELTKQEYNRC